VYQVGKEIKRISIYKVSWLGTLEPSKLEGPYWSNDTHIRCGMLRSL